PNGYSRLVWRDAPNLLMLRVTESSLNSFPCASLPVILIGHRNWSRDDRRCWGKDWVAMNCAFLLDHLGSSAGCSGRASNRRFPGISYHRCGGGLKRKQQRETRHRKVSST